MEEERRTHELSKQIQQEREQEELAKIAGKSSQLDRGIDWMYNHGQECAKEDAVKEQEEYLLGKRIGSTSFAAGDFATAVDGAEGVNKVLAEQEKHLAEGQHDSKPAAVWTEPSVAEKNESFRQRMEDPMYAVTLKAREMERAMANKAKLYEKVTGKTAVVVDKEEEKSRRKKDKKKKHKKRLRRRHEEDLTSDSDSYSYRRSSKRRRSRSPTSYIRSDDKEKEHHRKRRSRSPERRRDHDRHSYRERNMDSYDSRDLHYHTSRHYNAVRKSPTRRDYDNDYPRSHRPHDRDSDGRDHSQTMNNARKDEYEQARKYGLQGGSIGNVHDLGPNAEIMRRKREEREAEKKQRESAGRSRQMTPEERAAALREMQRNAHSRREHVNDRSKDHSHNDVDERRARGGGSFLNDMKREAHGIDGTGLSMCDRIQQNRHTNQRSHESFL